MVNIGDPIEKGEATGWIKGIKHPKGALAEVDLQTEPCKQRTSAVKEQFELWEKSAVRELCTFLCTFSRGGGGGFPATWLIGGYLLCVYLLIGVIISVLAPYIF